jgi:DNA-binding MarR family transcriptional regulator
MAKASKAPLIGFSLFRLAEYFNHYFIRELQERGITDLRVSHLSVFRELQESGSRITDMATRANITKQSMSALVEYLEKRAYVRRVPDPSDKRAHLIRFTKKGRQVREFGMGIGAEIEAGWARHLGDKKIKQLHSLLSSLDEKIRLEQATK